MDNYSNYSELKKNNTSFDIIPDNQNTDNNYDYNSIFNIINEHKKRLQEIRDWRNNFPSIKNKNYSCSTTNIFQNNDDINNNNSYFEYQDNNQSNLENAKDFLRSNTKNNSNYYISNENIYHNNNSSNNNTNSSIPKNIYCNCNSISRNNSDVKSSTLNSQINNKEIYGIINNNINIKMLEEKLIQKKLKIKSLKTNIENLNKEVENLKKHNNDLELKLQNINENINIQNNNDFNNNESNLYEKTNKIEKNNTNIQPKVNNLQKESQNKTTNSEINNENNNNTENTLIQNYINEMNKIMFALNDFIKRIYNSVPILNQNLGSFTDVIDADQLKYHLKIIEDYINGVGVPGTDNKSPFKFNNNEFSKYDDLEKKIFEITEENKMLEKKIKEKNKSSKKFKKNTKKSANSSINKGNKGKGVMKKTGSKIKIK